MCKWGQTEGVTMRIMMEPDGACGPPVLLKDPYWEERPVDRCIADIVRGLQEGPVYTLQSCCGHGKDFGSIWLVDGRTLYISDIEVRDHWALAKYALVRAFRHCWFYWRVWARNARAGRGSNPLDTAGTSASIQETGDQ